MSNTVDSTEPIAAPSFFKRVQTWAENVFHHEEDAHPALMVEAAERIHILEGGMAELRLDLAALKAKVVPEVEAAAGAAIGEAEKAAVSAITGTPAV